MTTLKDSVQQHRQMGRGRTATWIALAAAAFVAVVWIAAPFASQQRFAAWSHHGSGYRSHSLAELALVERAAAVLTAETLDRSEIDALQAEARQLAAEVVDASFTLIADVSAELTPDQRADLIRHWVRR